MSGEYSEKFGEHFPEKSETSPGKASRNGPRMVCGRSPMVPKHSWDNPGSSPKKSDLCAKTGPKPTRTLSHLCEYGTFSIVQTRDILNCENMRHCQL